LDEIDPANDRAKETVTRGTPGVRLGKPIQSFDDPAESLVHLSA
jgi:hypothetical protein